VQLLYPEIFFVMLALNTLVEIRIIGWKVNIKNERTFVSSSTFRGFYGST